MEHQNGIVSKIPKERLAEWIFRLVILVGVLYLSANYVSVKDYRADQASRAAIEETKTKALAEIGTTLARIDERLKVDDTKARVQRLEDIVHTLETKTK